MGCAGRLVAHGHIDGGFIRSMLPSLMQTFPGNSYSDKDDQDYLVMPFPNPLYVSSVYLGTIILIIVKR